MSAVLQRPVRKARGTTESAEQEALARVPGRNELEKRRVLRRLLRVKRYLESDAARSKTLRELAELSGYSPWHLQRLYKHVFGVAPHAVATERRLAQAAQLLRETDEPLAAICTAVGFAHRSAFSRLFKQTYGVSPTHYRLAVE